MPRYRKNKNKNKNNKNKNKNNEAKKDCQKESNALVVNSDDLNLNSNNTDEEINSLCTETESNSSNCNDTNQQSENITIDENNTDSKEVVDVILEKEVSDSGIINPTVITLVSDDIKSSITTKEIQIIDSTDLQNSDSCSKIVNESPDLDDIKISLKTEEIEIIDSTELENSTENENVVNTAYNDEHYSQSNVTSSVNEPIITNDTNSEEFSINDSSDNINEMSENISANNQDNSQIVEEELNTSNSSDSKKHHPDYKIRREIKRAALENHFLPKFINPIYLDSIKEENNEIIEKDKQSEFTGLNYVSNDTTLNSNNEEIISEDDVFEEIASKTTTDDDVLEEIGGKTISQHIFNNDVILEEIEPSILEFEALVNENFKENLNLTTKSENLYDLNTKDENNINNRDNKILDQELVKNLNDDSNENIISTTFTNPTQMEILTTNMPSSHTNSNEENKYFEKYKYIKPPATNEIEKPENNFQINCQIVSQKILNIAEEIFTDKSNNKNSNEENNNNIEYNKLQDINNFIEKLDTKSNNTESNKDINKTTFIKIEMDISNDNNDKVKPIKTVENSPVLLNDQYDNKPSIINSADGLSTSNDENQQLIINKNEFNNFSEKQIKPLRLICTETLASMPYGEDILEELAAVAKSLSHLTQQHQNTNCFQSHVNHTHNPEPETLISNKSALTNLNNSIPLSSSLSETKNNTCPKKNNPELINYPSSSSEYNSTNSIKNLLNTTNKLSKDFQGSNELGGHQIEDDSISEMKKKLISSQTSLPKSDDAENIKVSNQSFFSNNDPENNYKILESVQNATQQSSNGNFLNKINTNHHIEKEIVTTTSTQNKNAEEQSSIKNNITNIFDKEKDQQNNERIVNIEIIKSPFCSQLRQTSQKIYSDKDIQLNNDDKNITTNNNEFSNLNKKSIELNENENNLKDKFNKIMSDFKLATINSADDGGVPKIPPRKEFNQFFINRNENKTKSNLDLNTNTNNNNNNFGYDEFRKRAKEKAIQRVKSEYFEREHFFKDFNRFSEIYNDEFFAKITDDDNTNNMNKKSKIINIPIKLETNNENIKNQQIVPEQKLKTQPPPPQKNDVKQNETISPKIRNIPINLEDSNEFKMSENLTEKCPQSPYSPNNNNNKIYDFDIRPRTGKIRAPRLTNSTIDLPFTTNVDHFKDSYPYHRSYIRKSQHSSSQSLNEELPFTNYFSQKFSTPSLINTSDWHEKHIKEFNKLEHDQSQVIEEMNKLHEKRRLFSKEFRSNQTKSLSDAEIFREEMRNEWLNKIAEQEERRMQKTIKISKIITDDITAATSSIRNNKKLNLTDEFLKRVEERRSKLCMTSDSDWESGSESQPIPRNNNDEINKDEIESKVKVLDGQKEKDLKNLPKHLVEFAEFVKKFEEEHLKENRILKNDYWSADQKPAEELSTPSSEKQPPTPPPLPLWSPKPSPTAERKEFRPVKFESPTLPRRYVQLNSAPIAPPPWSYTDSKRDHHQQQIFNNNPITSSTEKLTRQDGYIETEKKASYKADNSALHELNEFTNSINEDYISAIESENDRCKNMAQLSRKKLEGVGPTTKDGIPISLRSEVDQNNQHKWYKTMFNTLHKVHDGDESVIIRYKCPRGRYLYKSKGYMSEPEANDSNYSTMKYTNKLGKRTTSTGGNDDDDQIYGTMSNLSKYGTYRRQPGKIEDFTPCASSVTSEIKKTHQQWDQQKLSPKYTEGNLSRVLKEQGYDNETNLVFRKRGEPQSSPLSPVEQKQVYLNVQSGGEPPLNGFRKPAPEKPKEEKDFQYIPLATEMTKRRHHKECLQKDINHYPTHRTITTQNTVSFLPISKFLIQPPTPPNRSSSKTRTSDSFKMCFNTKKSTPSSERHRKCFDTDFFTKPSSDKFKTISLRKNKYLDNIFRSQSGGAINKIDMKTDKKEAIQINGANKHYNRIGSISPLIKTTSRFTKRPSSLSPIAFGRSLSKERAFAVEKRRLEESLPLCKKSFTASTNILRDPSLKSPNEVKKAVQNFAHCHTTPKDKGTQKRLSPNYSKSISCSQKMPCTKKKVTVVNKRKDKLLKFSYSLVSRGIDIQNVKNNKAINMNKDSHKTNSTISLTRTSSTFSVDSNESKGKKTLQHSNTYPKSKSSLHTKSTASGVNSLLICPRKTEVTESNKNIRQYRDSIIDKEIKENILNHQESFRSDNFFQNLFLRDVLPSIRSRDESDSRMSSNVEEKAQFWSKFSAKSEPSLQHLSQNQSVPTTKFITCHIQSCEQSQNFHRDNESSDEEYQPRYSKKIEHRSRSEPRSQICLTEQSSPLSPTISVRQQSNSGNKRFSPTREVRIPVKEVQSLTPSVDEFYNQNFEIDSDEIRPHFSISSSPKKITKSFSPTREIRVSQENQRSYFPYPYNINDNRSLSPTCKIRFDNQNNNDIKYCTKGSRSKSFSPTREIRICPDRNITLPQMIPTQQVGIQIRSLSPIRKDKSSNLEASDTSKRKIKEESRNGAIEIPQRKDLRSPSHRRIQSFREIRKCEPKTLIRASSLSSADDHKQKKISNISQPSLSKTDIKKTTQENKKHSNKFLDLNNFYSNIERFGQLEHATSATDLRVIRKQRSTVDYDEWKKIRAHKRAEKELNYVLRAIKQDEREKDFLFRPKELEDIKWTESNDCGLRCKEKSVEDLRDSFEKTIKFEKSDQSKKIETCKDIYKPHWRAMTVADLATNMQEKYNTEKTAIDTENLQQNCRNLGFSKKIISTLSKEQIHKIKDQLNEIYSSPLIDESYKYSIKTEIPSSSSQQKHSLNYNTELLTSDRKDKDDTIKYKSHPKYINPNRTEKKLHNSKSCDRIPTTYVRKEPELNESEKKKLSKSLSQEIKTKGLELRKSRSNHIVPTDKEPKGTIKDSRQTSNRNIAIFPSKSEIMIRNDVSYRNIPIDKLSCDSKPLDESKETVKENVNKKIKYFEEIKKEIPPKTIYHAREYSSPDEDDVIRQIDEKIKAKECQEKKSNISYHHKELSSSASDFKELFGESYSIRANYLESPQTTTDPSEIILNYRTCFNNNNSFTNSDYNYGSTSHNYENVYRSRSMSPIRERTYKHIWDNINTGSVKKIKNKFENINSTLKGRTGSNSLLRKINSDPALHKQQSINNNNNNNKTTIKSYENSDVSCIAYKFENKDAQSCRGRPRYRKNLSPIPRVQIKKSDLMMPHIDIISKTASLKQKLGKISLTNPNQSKILRSGKVDRIRCKFDHCSVLSQIYSSSPDISELKDISSYLRGEWIAHKYPNKIDNDKTSISLEDQINYKRNKSKQIRRPSSTSPLPKKTIVTSILKPYYNSFGNQTFESFVNQPKSCYAEKSNQIQQDSTGVTFEENDIVPTTPPPPPKGVTFTDNGINSSESYFRCFEDIVNKSPIRYECKDIIQDEELAHQQRESLAKIYQKEREKKYVQELQNMNNRRHTDNYTPLHKLQIPLNRYDDFNADLPEPKKIQKTLVKALYNFNGESERELSFKKGDVMYVRGMVDTNWYEGENNGKVGLLPVNYIQIISKNGIQQLPQKKNSEGQGRAKFNFQAQSAVELSLNKGELVTLIKQVDENWFEGKIANRKGIFPVSYVEVLTDIGAEDLNKPFKSAATINQPSLDMLRTNLNHEFNTLTNGHPANEILKETKTQILHVDTDSQPIAFRALYKYRPQNNDELALEESDIIYVLEMCDDGWYVGTSQRTGCFGTFPGNYVERV